MYDLMILGGGPAGYCAAERAGEAGLSVILFEKRSLGGVCLNEGCIPSKALLHSAKLYESALHGGDYGVTIAGASLDHAAVIARKNKVVRALVAGVRARMKHAGVTVAEGEAALAGRIGEGFAAECGGQAYKARRLLIAAGSEPVVPPVPGLREGLAAGFVLTNREALDLPAPPERLAVIGGGVIGLEMASYYRSAGSRVTVVEMLDHIAGLTDEEIGRRLQKQLEKDGVAFHLSARVTAVEKDAVVFEKDGQSRRIACDRALLSVGRRAVTAGYGLETLGVALDRGAVATDARMRTSTAGVWAAGDVNGKSMLAHTAYREAEVAVCDMLGRRDVMRYDAIPAVIYTKPEAAGVGLTAAQAREAGLDAECVDLPFQYSGRYVAEVERGDGLARALFDRKTRRLLGAHLYGSYASEMIWGAAACVEGEFRVEDLRQIVFPHPTVSEIIREAAWASKL